MPTTDPDAPIVLVQTIDGTEREFIAVDEDQATALAAVGWKKQSKAAAAKKQQSEEK